MTPKLQPENCLAPLSDDQGICRSFAKVALIEPVLQIVC